LSFLALLAELAHVDFEKKALLPFLVFDVVGPEVLFSIFDNPPGKIQKVTPLLKMTFRHCHVVKQ
jgi:hypothetical protein